MPKQPEAADLLGPLNKSTDFNRKLFLFFLGLIAYTLLSVVGTSDHMLFLPQSEMKLPLLGVTIPLFGFYLLTPLLILAMHINLLYQLKLHRELFLQYRAQGGEAYKLSPFLYNQAEEPRGTLTLFLKIILAFFYLFAAPLCLALIQIRFADYHEIWATRFQHMMVWLNCLLVIWYLRQLALQGKRERIRQIPLYGLLVLLLGIASQHMHISTEVTVGKLRSKAEILGSYAGTSLEPLFWPVISLSGGSLIQKALEPEIQLALLSEPKLQKHLLEFIKGLNLSKRNFRHANFSRARLTNANFTGADLAFANFENAQMEGVKLYLIHAPHSQLNGANLRGANLLDAQLMQANLTGAKLDQAILINADLNQAQLHEASLEGIVYLPNQLKVAVMDRSQRKLLGLE